MAAGLAFPEEVIMLDAVREVAWKDNLHLGDADA
jgi:hypothetical protein